MTWLEINAKQHMTIFMKFLHLGWFGITFHLQKYKLDITEKIDNLLVLLL